MTASPSSKTKLDPHKKTIFGKLKYALSQMSDVGKSFSFQSNDLTSRRKKSHFYDSPPQHKKEKKSRLGKVNDSSNDDSTNDKRNENFELISSKALRLMNNSYSLPNLIQKIKNVEERVENEESINFIEHISLIRKENQILILFN